MISSSLIKSIKRGATHLIDLAVWLKDGICDRQYGGVQEKRGKVLGVLGHTTDAQGAMTVKGVLVEVALAIKLGAQVST